MTISLEEFTESCSKDATTDLITLAREELGLDPAPSTPRETLLIAMHAAYAEKQGESGPPVPVLAPEPVPASGTVTVRCARPGGMRRAGRQWPRRSTYADGVLPLDVLEALARDKAFKVTVS